ncbi:bacillithiol biosynthesis cysteine-adding enzyme BshC [Myroides odoratus]|uniref:bacillithiol biosynthesis cysteine-adding enzyme BshC n=1 Tax=Myroides odoratus TaxID=256 RepID=UPI00216A77B2|nr:bacillithiol biosynthesis cysteine-adding enzyme BshC [Myroides odoratus]MCS4239654.1 bacillithiol biosynthesis cysteine-adding enzyme BshC [Myroides odoratus]MDH6599338.1 bacillithiol biosynthesis cysteine-adding enzyme BshC [Myroides gitamensis]
MTIPTITFQNSGYFSKLMVDYLNQAEKLKPLYQHFPTLANFKLQIEAKQQHFSTEKRRVLHDALVEQYQGIELSAATQQNIALLREENTFTITTGHQLNLFTGPLYFLYKIVSTINLTVELKQQYPAYNFVPVFWMATEDHDFEEINHFYFQDKKICWDQESKGPVGRLSTATLDKVYEVFKGQLNAGDHAKKLKTLFEESYLKHDNLADATRYLANALFEFYGLVIVDGDHVQLKSLFAPSIQQELLQQNAIQEVEKTYAILEDYFVQVTPRDINLFYIQDQLRERIIWDQDRFKINNTTLSFSKEEILAELSNHPERFSPNVILRPLYQETILPNLCYIGGGGELAYWLQLKPVFDLHQVDFPMLLLRNSVLLATEKQVKKLDKLQLTWSDVFAPAEVLLQKKSAELSDVSFDFDAQRQVLQQQFDQLRALAQQTDASFIGAVNAQEKKQIKGLDHLEKRLQKAEKKKNKEVLDRILAIQLELFPKNSLQERYYNFAQFYQETGDDLIQKLVEQLRPLDHDFDIITL